MDQWIKANNVLQLVRQQGSLHCLPTLGLGSRQPRGQLKTTVHSNANLCPPFHWSLNSSNTKDIIIRLLIAKGKLFLSASRPLILVNKCIVNGP